VLGRALERPKDQQSPPPGGRLQRRPTPPAGSRAKSGHQPGVSRTRRAGESIVPSPTKGPAKRTLTLRRCTTSKFLVRGGRGADHPPSRPRRRIRHRLRGPGDQDLQDRPRSRSAPTFDLNIRPTRAAHRLRRARLNIKGSQVKHQPLQRARRASWRALIFKGRPAGPGPRLCRGRLRRSPQQGRRLSGSGGGGRRPAGAPAGGLSPGARRASQESLSTGRSSGSGRWPQAPAGAAAPAQDGQRRFRWADPGPHHDRGRPGRSGGRQGHHRHPGGERRGRKSSRQEETWRSELDACPDERRPRRPAKTGDDGQLQDREHQRRKAIAKG